MFCADYLHVTAEPPVCGGGILGNGQAFEFASFPITRTSQKGLPNDATTVLKFAWQGKFLLI